MYRFLEEFRKRRGICRDVNVVSLTNKLTDNPDAIIKIITRLGVDKIKYNASKGLITSTRPDPEADNPAGLLCYIHSLRCVITTRSDKGGNIITLVMDTLGLSFPKALEWIAKTCGFKIDDQKIKIPFHGFYKKIYTEEEKEELSIDVHDESELPDADSLSYRFLQDGIDLKVQEEFGIRYDHENDAILIPIRDYNGNLVGCKARNNAANVPSSKRWYAAIGYPKTQIVYGFYENYRNIINKKAIIIFESEKAVLQCRSFGCFNAVGIGGHNISKTQARYIKSLMCDKIIVAFDEGICEDEIKFEAKKLVEDNPLLKNNVFYLFDNTGEILKKGSKDSPSDHGKEVLQKMVKERMYKVGA